MDSRNILEVFRLRAPVSFRCSRNHGATLRMTGKCDMANRYFSETLPLPSAAVPHKASAYLAAGGDVLCRGRLHLHKGDVAVAIPSRRPAVCGFSLELGQVCRMFTLCAVDGNGARLHAVQPDFVFAQRRCI